MADAEKSIFNKRAAEKLRSPDDLDKFVQVTNPSVWTVLTACIALLVGLLAWGVFGAVDTNVTATGAVISVEQGDDVKVEPMCFLSHDAIAEVSVGDVADVGGVRMTVASVEKVPISADEAKAKVGTDYLFSELVKGNWAYPVTFEGDTSKLATDVPLPVNITVNSVAPISLIFKSRG